MNNMLAETYEVLFIGIVIIIAFMLFICLLRAVKGPRLTDRIVAVNMMGTMVIIMITVLALLLGESYLVDISLIYAMISFLAVVVLSKVYIGVVREAKEEKKDGHS